MIRLAPHTRMLAECEKRLAPYEWQRLSAAVEAEKRRMASRTAWRIEATLREFERFPPVDLWFDYPVHRLDTDGVLQDVRPETALDFRKKGADAKREKAANDLLHGINKVEIAVDALGGIGTATSPQLTSLLLKENAGTPESTIKKWIRAAGYKGESSRPWLLVKV